MSQIDTKEMCARAHEHGEDDASQGRAYIPHLYEDSEVQGYYQRGWQDANNR